MKDTDQHIEDTQLGTFHNFLESVSQSANPHSE